MRALDMSLGSILLHHEDDQPPLWRHAADRSCCTSAAAIARLLQRRCMQAMMGPAWQQHALHRKPPFCPQLYRSISAQSTDVLWAGLLNQLTSCGPAC